MMSDRVQLLQQGAEHVAAMTSLPKPTLPSPEYLKDRSLQMLMSPSSRGRVEPTFIYVAQKFDSFVIPQAHGRKMDNFIALGMQNNWNAIIEEYIVQGKDTPSRSEIERAAKIGPASSLGGVKCNNVERSADANSRFHQCSQCHLSVYCSQECQCLAWPTQKTDPPV
ncbi:hypothetical protein EW146_g1060 [Bondarzewia mesenterica]|uniref:MYND-type domain-containing protein n=1 Tax=Bondarzewia mesenterica TaxID=1095465 RepID=A0A4S4M5J9_9AGAM|nr:hypothetical protein EW146_g1060 [Bondarzewia mesenterica]